MEKGALRWRRSAVDRTGQGWLRRHELDHRTAVARLRRDGGLPGADRDPGVSGSRSAAGITATGSVNTSARGCASARSTRSSNSASCSGCRLPRWATDRPSRTWITCASAGSSRQPRGLPAATCAVADVGRRAGFRRTRAGVGRGRRPVRLAAKGICHMTHRRAAAGRFAGHRPDRVLGRAAATHLLAAFGADVIKIESIQRPDGIRYSGGCAPTSTTGGNTAGCSRPATPTSAVTLELEAGTASGRQGSHQPGRCGHRELLAAGDGPLRARRGRVARLNPRLVVVRMPAFGLTGRGGTGSASRRPWNRSPAWPG